MKHTEKNIFLQQSHQFRIESHINISFVFAISFYQLLYLFQFLESLFKFPIHFIRETLYIFTYIHRVTLEFTPVYENLEDAVLLRYARIYIYIFTFVIRIHTHIHAQTDTTHRAHPLQTINHPYSFTLVADLRLLQPLYGALNCCRSAQLFRELSVAH